MRFKEDLFVSYAQIDDEALSEDQVGWVTSLHRSLEIRVGQLLGTKPRIWRDPKLQGNAQFADVLIEKLAEVGLLLAVLSPRYSQSEWCLRELGAFSKGAEASGGNAVEHQSRTFKVIKTPIPLEQHPPELREMVGYEFFVIDPDTGRARELGQALGSDAERLYWAKLDDLAFDISEILRKLEPEFGGSAATTEWKDTVYIAETGVDLKTEREAVKRDLQRRGYRVLPDQPLPVVASDLEVIVRDQLAQCSLSIHLIGKSRGFVPDGESVSVLELQNNLAIQRSADGGFEHLIWMPEALAVDEASQQDFIERLRDDPRAQSDTDLLETPLSDLTTVIDQTLQQLAEETPPGEEAPEGGPDFRRLYLIFDSADAEEVGPLSDHLFDRGLEVITPVFEGDEAQLRSDHEENLRLCDAAMIVYGAGSELWLRRKLRELLKSAGLGRSAPLIAQAIYVTGPETPHKSRLRTREAEVIQAPDGFSPEPLESFLARLT